MLRYCNWIAHHHRLFADRYRYGVLFWWRPVKITGGTAPIVDEALSKTDAAVCHAVDPIPLHYWKPDGDRPIINDINVTTIGLPSVTRGSCLSSYNPAPTLVR